MGGIWFAKVDLYEFIIENIGYKAGLIIGKKEIDKFLPEEFEYISKLDEYSSVRLRSEEAEYLIAAMLKKVGNISSASTVPSHISLYHKAKKNGDLNSYMRAMELLMDAFRRKPPQEQFNGDKFLEQIKKEESDMVYLMSVLIITGLQKDIHRSPWGRYRTIDWKDRRALESLFQSESLQTMHGKFFDERFINYLNENFEDIGKVNWRQFEGLVAEYFDKQGFHVKIGPGRKDGGIDIKIWPKEEDKTKPPLILVQCKREKNKISGIVVKALYADILNEKASSGFIVTTSSLSKDARQICKVRNYPIEEAERATLKKWIESMRRAHKDLF